MKLIVNKSQRKAKMRSHTATHLLHAELSNILPNTKQMWSLVDEDLVRFDFASDVLLSNVQINEIESNINQLIKSDYPIYIYEKPLEEAKNMWAKAFFEDKYGDIVRVVCIWDNKSKTSKQKLYLIFDFDGVLWDSFDKSIEAHTWIFESKTYDQAKDWVVKYANQKPFHTKDSILSKEKEEETLKWMILFGEYMSWLKIGLFDDFVKSVVNIPNAHLAIVSSGMKDYIIPTLWEYAKYFDYIYDYEDNRSKESKLELVCNNWWIDKSQTYYFTDTLADVYEFEKLLRKDQLIWCAWWFSGFDNLSKELPANQIITDPWWLPEFLDKYIYNRDNLISNISDRLLSIELCWWTHVESTGDIGIFKIISQQSVASGTKRILAYTWPKVMEYIYEQDQLLNEIWDKLSCEPKQSPEKLEKMIKDLDIANSTIESFKSSIIANISWQQTVKPNYTANIYIIDKWDILTLKDISNYLKWKSDNYIYVDDGGGFVIYSGDKQAKLIQSDLWIKWWWNEQMIQWKDENILGKLI